MAQFHDAPVRRPLQPKVAGEFGNRRPKADDGINALHDGLLQHVAIAVNTHCSNFRATTGRHPGDGRWRRPDCDELGADC